MSLDGAGTNGMAEERLERLERAVSSARVRVSTHHAAKLVQVLVDVSRTQDVRNPRDVQEDRTYLRVSWVAVGLLAAYLVFSLTNVFFPNGHMKIAAGLTFNAAVMLVIVSNVVRAWQNRALWRQFARPKLHLLAALQQSLDRDQADLDRLLAFDTPTLEHVRDLWGRRLIWQQTWTKAVFGLAGKAGAFPTFIAAGLAYWGNKNLSGGAAAWVAVLAALLVLNTVAAAELQLALADLRFIEALLDRALQLRTQQNAAAGEHKRHS